jgi:hypothetical protein
MRASAWAGHKINHPGGDPWITAVGKLVVNFGALELQTYFWLAQLHQQFPLPERDMRAFFKPRVDRIRALATADPACHQVLAEIGDNWDAAIDLASFRNRIVHSPLVFVWSGEDRGQAPDRVAVADFKAGGNPAIEPLVSLADLNAAVDKIPAVALKLEALYRAVWHKPSPTAI